MFAPLRIPSGIKNILNTEKSKLKAITAETGNQMAIALDDNEAHPDAIYTAVQTSQLANTDLMNKVLKGRDVLDRAVAIAASPSNPLLKAIQAINKDPRKFPAYENDQFFNKSFMEAFFSTKAEVK
mmetsp:Transcript_31057/g.29657  ORF Transcript_31057/g.29657 Transcript_31057/m.29657 type:complete len:126 (+) Transcript_31057:468-845(+)